MREFLQVYVSTVIHSYNLEVVDGKSEVDKTFHRRYADTAAVFNFQNGEAELRVVPTCPSS